MQQQTNSQSIERLIPVGAPRPLIVCLCGSMRFKEAYEQANLHETLAGNIVLTVGTTRFTDDQLFEYLEVNSEDQRKSIKTMLGVVHLRKIEMADEMLVLNPGGYIGESTAFEIMYARSKGKRIRYLVEPKQESNNNGKES